MKDVSMKHMDWVARTSFTFVTPDDYEVIFGQEFLQMEKAIPIPHADYLAIMSGQAPCLVLMIRESKGMKVSSFWLVENQKPYADTNE
jgi:hypothetical protein